MDQVKFVEDSRVRISDLRIAIYGSNLSFRGSLQAVFVKFANQNFASVGIFVFRETTKFLFTLKLISYSKEC